MSGDDKPKHNPYEGSFTVDVPLPAHATKSGRAEIVPITFRYGPVRATRAMTESDWVAWDIDQARRSLDEARRQLAKGVSYTDALWSALNHAAAAWCRQHGKRTGSWIDCRFDLLEHAPADLASRLSRAWDGFTFSNLAPSGEVRLGRVSDFIAAVSAVLPQSPSSSDIPG